MTVNGMGNVELIRDLAASVERRKGCTAPDVAALVVLGEDAMGQEWMLDQTEQSRVAGYSAGWQGFVLFARELASRIEAHFNNVTEGVV